jgi:biopolymer transport protein ExbB
MRRKSAGYFLSALFSLLIGISAMPSAANAWWNDEWELRKQLTIDTSATGAAISDQIGVTQVLVRLHSGNFNFEMAKEDGADLRFVAEDDKTPLKFHIEKFDRLLGEAFVWVGLPDLKPGAQTRFWLYYGNLKAAAAEDAKGTFDPDTILAYHFTERGVPVRDYTTWGNTAQNAGATGDGAMIGPGLRLDGQITVTLPQSASLTWSNGAALTWSAWVKMNAPQPNAIVFGRRDGVAFLNIGLDNGVPFVEAGNAFGVQRTLPGPAIAAGEWHHIAVVADGQTITLFVDGNAFANMASTLATMTTAARLGGEVPAPVVEPAPAEAPPAAPVDGAAPAGAADPTAVPPVEAAPLAPIAPAAVNFVGEIDELEISKVARPAGYIKAAAVGQGAENAKFLTFSIDEETASWLSGYFAVIVKSVTLDAWVVIGILAIMAVISWVVIAEKMSFVNRQAKANEAFLDRYDTIAGDFSALARDDAGLAKLVGGDTKSVQHSSLYRIFLAGAREVRRRIYSRNAGPSHLSAEAIAAIRATLDGVQVREIQRLNRQVVLLTIAISGGPFLGLLGTVVGVMITFAAIAASGDVNVNAIAPGIAAALLATVAGLAVAIPAMFAYNYLNTRIKNAVSDIQVFIDEFITQVAEFHAPQVDVPSPLFGDTEAAE